MNLLELNTDWVHQVMLRNFFEIGNRFGKKANKFSIHFDKNTSLTFALAYFACLLASCWHMGEWNTQRRWNQRHFDYAWIETCRIVNRKAIKSPIEKLPEIEQCDRASTTSTQHQTHTRTHFKPEFICIRELIWLSGLSPLLALYSSMLIHWFYSKRQYEHLFIFFVCLFFCLSACVWTNPTEYRQWKRKVQVQSVVLSEVIKAV